MKNSQRKIRMFSGIATSVVLVAGMAASSAFARDKMMGDGDMMAKMDTNKDGMVSSTEHAAFAKMMFDKMDANRDGSVTKAEMDAGMKMMHDTHMKSGTMGSDHHAKDAMKKDDGMSTQKSP